MEASKSKYEAEVDILMKSKFIKTGTKVIIGIAALYFLSKIFSVVGNTVLSFKQMRNSFKR